MAFHCEGTDEPSVLDLFGGREDLENGVIRAVGDPDTRFSEDALRLLRAVRFAVKLGFRIEENTRAAIGRQAEGLARVSRERISEEFQKILTSPRPEEGVALLTELGLMDHVLPGGFAPCGAGKLSALPAEFALRMAVIQWGVGSEALGRNLAGLRLPNAVSKQIQTLVRPTLLPSAVTPREARQWRHALGELALPALTVRMARDSSADLAAFYELVRASEERGEPVRIADLAVDGHDLMALGFKPGRPLQDVFCDLLEVIWNDPTKNTRETLLQEAARMLE
jgi:tRNA nucleotidyltransferase (CCA-adding enzyme)